MSYFAPFFVAYLRPSTLFDNELTLSSVELGLSGGAREF
jgi:hypothetical protein